MIAFSFGYILLSLLALIGVVFVIYGLSHKNPPRLTGREEQAHGRYLLEATPISAKEGGGVNRPYEPEIPKKFDTDFIQRQLAKVQHSPNVISCYFNRLEAHFRGDQEMRLLKKLKEYNLLIAEGIKSDLEIAQAKAELRKALIKLDMVSGSRYANLVEDDEFSILEERIAARRANIQNLQPKRSEEPERKTNPSPQEVRERMEGRWKVKADDDAAKDRFIRNLLAEMDEEERQELEDLERETELSEDYKARKRYQIQARYAKRKEKLFNDIPQ